MSAIIAAAKLSSWARKPGSSAPASPVARPPATEPASGLESRRSASRAASSRARAAGSPGGSSAASPASSAPSSSSSALARLISHTAGPVPPWARSGGIRSRIVSIQKAWSTARTSTREAVVTPVGR